MSRRLAVGLAAVALLVLAPTTPDAQAESTPGPRQPVEHLTLRAEAFTTTSGDTRCYIGTGFLTAAFPVPSPATIVGATAYVDDPSTTGGLGLGLVRRGLLDNSTLNFGYTNVAGAPGRVAVDLNVQEPVQLDAGQTLRMDIGVNKGTCFLGGEIHYIRGAR